MGIRAMLGMSDPAADRRKRMEDLASQVTHGLRNFAKAGDALRTIRDEQLFRCTHKTFEAFCLERWNLSEAHATRLIQAADVVRNCLPMGNVPLNERQARVLTPLPAEQQREVMAEVVAQGRPTLATVTAAVDKRRPSKPKRKPKPIRLRVPGAIVIIERRNAETDTAQALRDALTVLQREETKAA